MKYMAFYIADFLYPDERIRDFREFMEDGELWQ